MAQFDGCMLEMKLTAQTPMIHFQADENGATVRATELKPKLDRYLLKTDPNLKEKHPEFFTDEKKGALKYKVQIFCEKPGKVIPLDEYSIYFGNMGRKKEERIHGLISDPTLVIICLHKGLRDLIEDNIVDFFLSTNFGTMQNKGFGSFLPEELQWEKELKEEGKKRVAAALKRRVGSAHCYVDAFDGGITMNKRGDGQEKTLPYVYKRILNFCTIMKSGKRGTPSYLFEYMRKKCPGLHNEKEWIRANLLSSVSPDKSISGQNTRYMRAFLGTADTIFYRGEGKVTIGNTDEDGDQGVLIERIPNPLYFKIIRNCVFVTTSQIKSELYGKQFQFKWKGRSGNITTLRNTDLPDGFDMDTFLADYIDYYNKYTKSKIEEVADF